MSEPGISRARAHEHETLVLRLDALLADLRPRAARAPEGAVDAALRIAAEGLLFDAARFRPRRRREPFPAAAATLGALAVELGQARAGLEAFELAHSHWSPRHKAFLWRVAGPVRPVARLRGHADIVEPAATAHDKKRRGDLARMFSARIERAYDEGYAHAQSGKPPIGSIPSKRRPFG